MAPDSGMWRSEGVVSENQDGNFVPRSRAQEAPMPARTEKQRRFMGAELERKREGKKTRTDMTERQLEDFASKKPSSSTQSKSKADGS